MCESLVIAYGEIDCDFILARTSRAALMDVHASRIDFGAKVVMRDIFTTSVDNCHRVKNPLSVYINGKYAGSTELIKAYLVRACEDDHRR